MFDTEKLWPQPREFTMRGEFPFPRRIVCSGYPLTDRRIRDFHAIAGLPATTGTAEEGDYPLRLVLEPGSTPEQGYHLTLAAAGGRLQAGDRPGMAYGLETLLQILSLARASASCPALEIRDWPQYRTRSFMVDLGRSVYPPAMLKRIIRILSRLKMNQLHLHLYDDELCGLRFDGLPFGTENPYALSLDQLRDLIAYAAEYHVTIVPELEGWAHVGSLVYHRPELRGGPGMYNGSAFLVGEEAFSLMELLLDQVVPLLPSPAVVHLGLDEAHWYPADDLPDGYTPERMVGRYWRILSACGERHGREVTLRLWADHQERPVPPEVQPHAIIEPWQYWIANAPEIDRAIGRYSGRDKMRWMMGAGQSVAHYRGAWHATRYWCRRAVDSPNVEGANITFWGANNLERNFISLFAGSFYLWHPLAHTTYSDLDDYEAYDRKVGPLMRSWRSRFRDAFPDEMIRDAGPQVHMGYYLWGERHGEPVAPSVPAAGTSGGHDYLNEHRETETEGGGQ